VSVAAAVMTGLIVVGGGIVRARGGKQRASEKKENEKFHRRARPYGWDMAAAAAAFCSFIMFWVSIMF
jgi:hypothetical protein